MDYHTPTRLINSHPLATDPVWVDRLAQASPGSVVGERSNKQVIDLNEYLDGPWKIDPSRPCYACEEMNYQAYPDGSGFFCANCHPKG